VLWLPKDPKIKEGKFLFPWTSPFQVKKAFNNNIVQLSTLSDEDITLVNVNTLKVYQNPIINLWFSKSFKNVFFSIDGIPVLST